MGTIQIDKVIKYLFVVILAITFVSDTIVIFYLKEHKFVMPNYYYSLHDKFGLLRSALIKLSGGLFLVYGLIIEPSGKSGSVFTIITAYFIAVIKLFIDYKKAKIE